MTIYKKPKAYFITFTTYGSWLHGDERTSTSTEVNQVGTPKISHNKKLNTLMKNNMNHTTFYMGAALRQVVLTSIVDTCIYNNWILHAGHVRSNHVHIIIESAEKIEFVMQKIKIFASRSLNKKLSSAIKTRYWTRHGSTKYIWGENNLQSAVKYVVDGQGEKMAVFCADWFMK